MDDGYYSVKDDTILAECTINSECGRESFCSLTWNPVLKIFKLCLNLNSLLDYKALHSAV